MPAMFAKAALIVHGEHPSQVQTCANAISAVRYVSGPRFRRVSNILPPRALHVGATFSL